MNVTDFIPGANLVQMGMSILEKVLPDEKAREEAQRLLLQQEREGKLEEAKQQLSAIIAEANSSDPWTSRARPSFMYVIYVMILTGIPMGILSAFKPEMATQIAAGMQAWLAAVPDSLWTLFGVGYVGYTGARMYEKAKGAA